MFKKYFVAGLLFWVPLVVTVLTVQIVLDIFDKLMVHLPESVQPEVWLGYDVPGSGFILMLLIVWVTGLLVANFLGRRLVRLGERIVKKIPLVRTIHQGVKQGLEVVVSPNSDAFSQVVLVNFPHKDSWAVGLVTNVNEQTGIWTVFLPTTPNPTSGYVLLLDEADLRKIDMSVDEALKYIISLGTISENKLAFSIKSEALEKNK